MNVTSFYFELPGNKAWLTWIQLLIKIIHQIISVSNPYFVAHLQEICCEQLMFRSSCVTLDTEIPGFIFPFFLLDYHNLLSFALLKELTKIPEYSDS